MRRRFVFRRGTWIELDLDAPLPPPVAPSVLGDIAGYRSVITGEPIGSRSEHREHLRRHNCIEVGNDFPRYERTTLPPLKEDLERALQASPETHAEARAAAERAARVEITGVAS